MGVPRETDRRQQYLTLVAEWNSTINLVADASPAELQTRHWDDALQLLPLIPSEPSRLADLGSGGGFPAIPLAIKRPEIMVYALESDQRKHAFLTHVKWRLNLDNFVPVRTRIEAWDTTKVDWVTARACAPLEKLVAYALPLMHSSTRCFFLKGSRHAEEIETAQRHWTWDLTIHASRASEGSVILEMRNIVART